MMAMETVSDTVNSVVSVTGTMMVVVVISVSSMMMAVETVSDTVNSGCCHGRCWPAMVMTMAP